VPRPLPPNVQEISPPRHRGGAGPARHLTVVVDETVIGGVRVQVNGHVVDNT